MTKKYFSRQTLKAFLRSRASERGFTLMELLIVMAVIIIILTMAIPSFLNLKIQANETSAQRSLQAIHSAEIEFNSIYPTQGFACNLSELGGTGQAGPQAAQLLATDLSGGQKSGYTFAITGCTKVTVNGQDTYTSYQVTAVPQAPGKTGRRGFCSDMSGEIKSDPTGGTNCSQSQ